MSQDAQNVETMQDNTKAAAAPAEAHGQDHPRQGEDPLGQPSSDAPGHDGKVSMKAARFSEVQDEPQGAKVSVDLILDISMPVTVELGRTSMTVQELLELSTGSVVELDRMAGEPVDLLVRDVRFARGEVVVVENNFGLRITEILDPSGRIQRLTGE